MELVDIYRIFYRNTKEHTFYLAVHGIFSKIDHFVGHKTILYKFKKFEITPYIPSDHSTTKLKIDRQKKKLMKVNKSMKIK